MSVHPAVIGDLMERLGAKVGRKRVTSSNDVLAFSSRRLPKSMKAYGTIHTQRSKLLGKSI